MRTAIAARMSEQKRKHAGGDKKKGKKGKGDKKDKHNGRKWTVSVALPGSIVANAQTAELKTYLAGQVARALVIFNVDEVIIYADRRQPGAASKTTVGQFQVRAAPCAARKSRPVPGTACCAAPAAPRRRSAPAAWLCDAALPAGRGQRLFVRRRRLLGPCPAVPRDPAVPPSGALPHAQGPRLGSPLPPRNRRGHRSPSLLPLLPPLLLLLLTCHRCPLVLA